MQQIYIDPYKVNYDEIRIGNFMTIQSQDYMPPGVQDEYGFLYNYAKIVRIDKISLDEKSQKLFNDLPASRFLGVRIDSSILVHLGFLEVSEPEGWKHSNFDYFELVKRFSDDYVFIEYTDVYMGVQKGGIEYKVIKPIITNLHEIQNIYFTLTGLELKHPYRFINNKWGL